MKSIISLCCGASVAWLASAPSHAAVLCQKTNGAVAVRDACVKKETQVDLAAVGLQGPAVRAQSPSESYNNDQILDNGDVPEPLQFDEEIYDTDGMHPSSSYDVEGSKFTAAIAGLYSVSAGLIWYDPVTGYGVKRQLFLLKNGNQYIAGETIPPQSPGFTIQTVTGVIDLQAGDYVQAFASHDASIDLGAGLAQVGLIGDGRNFLSMTWIGPPP